MSLLTGRNDCCPLSDNNIQSGITSFGDVVAGGIILAETLLGALGNLPLLCHYLLRNCTESQVRTIDLIFMHLTLSNSLIIFFKGVPQAMDVSGRKNDFSDLECHLVSYGQRVGRSVSMGATCLLFVFQAIRISPIDSCWKNLKLRISHYVTISISIYWKYYLIIHLFFPLHKLHVSSKWGLLYNTTNRRRRYCYIDYDPNVSVPVYVALVVFPEVLFSVFIVWASGSMILFLHRHKQRVQHLRRNHLSSRSSAETRGTQRILALLSAFVCIYTPYSFLSMWLALTKNQNVVLYHTSVFIALSFPVVSPFLIMQLDRTVSRLSFALMMTKRSNDHNLNKKNVHVLLPFCFQIKHLAEKNENLKNKSHIRYIHNSSLKALCHVSVEHIRSVGPKRSLKPFSLTTASFSM